MKYIKREYFKGECEGCRTYQGIPSKGVTPKCKTVCSRYLALKDLEEVYALSREGVTP